MSNNEFDLTENVHEVETVDVLVEDIIRGMHDQLSAVARNDSTRRFVLVGQGPFVMAELREMSDIPEDAYFASATELVDDDGEIVDEYPGVGAEVSVI